MNLTEYIEKLYEKWDGTPENACEILRYINLAIKRQEIIDKDLLDYIKK